MMRRSSSSEAILSEENASSSVYMRQSSQWLPGQSLDDSVLDSPRRRTLSSAMISEFTTNQHPNAINNQRRKRRSRIYDDPIVTEGYASVPLLDMQQLPRGGISIETKAVGRVQFGIPPETIKDSMRLGLDVPRVYIVPAERFCRDIGPALGLNLAEFEFPAYFNFFVRQKRVILVVDSEEAERNIRDVFEETLLGPKEFRKDNSPLANKDEDFDPSFPKDRRPNFYEEFKYFRILDKNNPSKELTTDTLLDFCHFEPTHPDTRDSKDSSIGAPPIPEDVDDLIEDYHASFCGFEGSESNHSTRTQPGELMTSSIRSVHQAREIRSRRPEDDSHPEIQIPRLPFETDFGYRRQSQRRLLDDFPAYQNTRRRRSSAHDSLEGSIDDFFGITSSFISLSSRTLGDDAPKKQWMFSQVKWLAEVATVWPMDATEEQITNRSVPRVEIFRMPGGAEYIVHDVDETNTIIGKARFSSTVKVPDEIAVEGFRDDGTPPFTKLEVPLTSGSLHFSAITIQSDMPIFHPPSFGVTVLGNSHGFDKNGSTSGYVLWINGRGVMVDPPPYSSATLEKEGIRPQMIIGVIVTHCHADHDAGAFQKLLTGSRLAIITSPCIYNSFIRKYAALSGLRPSLLRQCHRFRPAIVGQALRFQGASFHFTYSLHTIPCLGFKVVFRRRSIVFTGDHLNSPEIIKNLVDTGVLSQGRAADLRELTMQDCDVLLHEAGAPPIHTPLKVLENLPEIVKERMYVVHTSALPAGSSLRVAPTGINGTIRLNCTDSSKMDQIHAAGKISARNSLSPEDLEVEVHSYENAGNPYLCVDGDSCSPSAEIMREIMNSKLGMSGPTDVSDAWFILNLLSNVPFFSTLSFANTMEVLEIVFIRVFVTGDLVVPASKRDEILCIVWEGTCIEQLREDDLNFEEGDVKFPPCVWYAGDWTGPLALQPDLGRSAAAPEANSRDVVAYSSEGVKTIMLQMHELEKILRRGSRQFRKYLSIKFNELETSSSTGFDQFFHNSNVHLDHSVVDGRSQSNEPNELLVALKFNSVLRDLPAIQKRTLESIAEGPRFFQAGAYLWEAGDRVNFAFLIISGSACFAMSTLSYLKSINQHKKTSNSNIVELDDGRLIELDKLLQDFTNDSEFSKLERMLSLRVERQEADAEDRENDELLPREIRAQRARDRFANKVLARLYASRKFTLGLTFTRGCFLSDTSRMVSGELVHESLDPSHNLEEKCHSSSMAAGGEGCTAMVFPRTTLVSFLDANPGLLLSLLGTQVIV